jgi:hypothetical protein
MSHSILFYTEKEFLNKIPCPDSASKFLPKWFQELPFDHAEMEAAIINNKIDNLIGVLDWDLESTTNTNTFGSLFSVN